MEGIEELKKGQMKYENEIKELRKENVEIRKENAEIKKELTEIKKSVGQMEKEKIKHNLVITGLKVDAVNKEMLQESTQTFIKDRLGIDTKIEVLYTPGPNKLVIKTQNMEEKLLILKNKMKLKEFRDQVVYINSDMTKEEREIQKLIIKQATELRKTKKTVRVGFQKLIIDGEVWKWCKNVGELIKDNQQKTKTNC